MKERPIIFSGAMVRALLDGRKTQTRRAIKPQPLGYTGRKYIVPDDAPKAWQDSDDFLSFCPYGQPGDRLWVRETWWQPSNPNPGEIEYRANGTILGCGKWRPSIHMPRWASRILLEVTDVRVERLQVIREADAKAEGAEPVLVPPDGGSCPHTQGFLEIWESINGADSWDANPWVWVVAFGVIDPSEATP